MLAPAARLAALRERDSRAARERMRAALTARLAAARARIALGAGRLDSLSPLAVLARGYAIVRRAEDDRIVRSAGDVERGDAPRDPGRRRKPGSDCHDRSPPLRISFGFSGFGATSR